MLQIDRAMAGAMAAIASVEARIGRRITRHAYIRATALMVVATAALLLVWLASQPGSELQLASYLPLHTFLETLSILACAMIFIIACELDGTRRNRNLSLLGAAFLGVALLDFMHTQSYLGMPAMITPSSPGKAINFWLAARLLAAAALLAVAWLSWERQIRAPLLWGWTTIVVAGVVLISWLILFRSDLMPQTFVPGRGLTPLKIWLEIAVIALSLAAAVGFWRMAVDQRRSPAAGARCDPIALLAAAIVTALAEVLFSIYSDVNGLFDVLGHVYKVVGAWFLYRGLVTVNLFEIETRNSLALEAAKLGVWSWDVQTGPIVLDAQAASIWGLAPGVHASMSVVDALVHPSDREAKQDAIRRALDPNSDGTYRAEYRLNRKSDSAQRHVLSLARTEFADAKPVRLIGVICDVTEHREVEDAVRRSETRLAGILSIAADAIISIDDAHRIRIFNHGAETIFGYTSAEVMGQRMEILLPERFRATHAEHVAHFAASGETARRMGERREVYGRRKDGTEFPAEASISKLVNGGECTFTVVLRDISARVERERALEASERRLNLALTTGRIGLYDHDHSSDRLYSSPLNRVIFGMSPDEETSIPRYLASIPEGERGAIARAIERAFDPAGDGVFAVEHRIERSPGEIRWVSVNAQTFFEGEGAARRRLRTIGVVRDITERKNAEVELRLSEERFRALANLSPAAIFRSDAHGATVFINERWSEITGLPVKQGLGYGWLPLIHPDDRERVQAAWRQAVEDGRNFRFEHRFLLPDGTVKWIDGEAVIERDGAGTVTGYVGALVDITAHKQAEQRLSLSNEELEAVVARRTAELRAESARLVEAHAALSRAQRMEAFGQLAGGIAHDFNNLLTVITGNHELLEMRLKDERDLTLLRRSQEAADMGARLTQRLLTFARRRQLEPTLLSLNEQIAGMTELLRRTIGDDIRLTTNLAPHLWSVRADASEIENAVLNLAINARDAMSNGGTIVIETAQVHIDDGEVGGQAKLQPGDYVRLTVTDNGTGMSPQVLGRAFEPFFTTKQQGKGTGLGLSTIYGFVQQSGGTITVYSELGKGTSINIYLPRAAESGDRSTVDRNEVAPSRAQGESILVVDDRADVRQVTSERLRSLGYAVVEAEHGTAAIEHLRTAAALVDLVFSDVVMPGGVSGYDLVRWVRSERPQIKVLLTSGFPEGPDGAQEAELPTVRLLRKPYTLSELARAVREVLDR